MTATRARSAVFRVDASSRIGSGHVVRSAALAAALSQRGWHVRFVARAEPGNMNVWLADQGFAVSVLPAGLADEADDARACLQLGGADADWLIVDHYQLGQTWERSAATPGVRLLAIDDLGRAHDCDMLLDQNFDNPLHAHYMNDVGISGARLLGPRFALLRPQFAQLRGQALARRNGQLQRMLVCMGGSDAENETSKVLAGLAALGNTGLSFDIVIGAANPNRASVEAACRRVAGACLHVQTAEMARLTLEADCAIGAGGTASWERCCLGLPALVTVMSEDQAKPSEALAGTGAQIVLGPGTALAPDDYARAILALDGQQLRRMSQAAFGVCDGGGAQHVADRLVEQSI